MTFAPFSLLVRILLLALAAGASHAAESFSFDALRESARQLAARPFAPCADKLDEYWKSLSYDQHRDIRFKMSEGLWAKEKLPFSIDFFHPGGTAKETVGIFEVAGGAANHLIFDRGLFDYGRQSVPPGIPPPPGYAGWRARCHLNTADYMDEFLVFLGSSYFRAIPAHSLYGLSARGLSINSGLPGVPEEFPVFKDFYLQRPEQTEKTLKAWAMLEGESVAGAYQFCITPGPETVMDIEAEITLRRPVQQLGLAAFSSMFWFGEGTHPRPMDFRPEVHDSDGVLMELESGALHYRPLDQARNRFRHCVFALEKPRSWSLVQRDRLFASYEDPEARYYDRPSVRVEPLDGFEKGRLHLIEMPVADETSDNVILLWDPVLGLEPGRPFRFHYRLRWMRDSNPPELFQVRATRIGAPVGQPDHIMLVVDFAKPLQPILREGGSKRDDIAGWKPVVTLNQSMAKLLHAGLIDLSQANAEDLPGDLGRSGRIQVPQVVRAFFVIEPPKDLGQIDLTCELRDASGKTISERWLYLWMRPG